MIFEPMDESPALYVAENVISWAHRAGISTLDAVVIFEKIHEIFEHY